MHTLHAKSMRCISINNVIKTVVIQKKLDSLLAVAHDHVYDIKRGFLEGLPYRMRTPLVFE